MTIRLETMETLTPFTNTVCLPVYTVCPLFPLAVAATRVLPSNSRQSRSSRVPFSFSLSLSLSVSLSRSLSDSRIETIGALQNKTENDKEDEILDLNRQLNDKLVLFKEYEKKNQQTNKPTKPKVWDKSNRIFWISFRSYLNAATGPIGEDADGGGGGINYGGEKRAVILGILSTEMKCFDLIWCFVPRFFGFFYGPVCLFRVKVKTRFFSDPGWIVERRVVESPYTKQGGGEGVQNVNRLLGRNVQCICNVWQ